MQSRVFPLNRQDYATNDPKRRFIKQDRYFFFLFFKCHPSQSEQVLLRAPVPLRTPAHDVQCARSIETKELLLIKTHAFEPVSGISASIRKTSCERKE